MLKNSQFACVDVDPGLAVQDAISNNDTGTLCRLLTNTRKSHKDSLSFACEKRQLDCIRLILNLDKENRHKIGKSQHDMTEAVLADDAEQLEELIREECVPTNALLYTAMHLMRHKCAKLLLETKLKFNFLLQYDRKTVLYYAMLYSNKNFSMSCGHKWWNSWLNSYNVT